MPWGHMGGGIPPDHLEESWDGVGEGERGRGREKGKRETGGEIGGYQVAFFPRFYGIPIKKVWEKAWYHHYVPDQKWWTWLVCNEYSIL